ncbi:TIR domain-containing protein [Caerostris extrusa]|uniref:TIR domain-containing protein n=1 Tax=Caerostris extrusa TaxID=172846 RepID=A0AAV4V1P1_CAEEX|nr:TIR domain-containing protein [Caerostris extrusa]
MDVDLPKLISKQSSYLIGIRLKSNDFGLQNDVQTLNDVQTQNDGAIIGSILCGSLVMHCNEFRELIISKLPLMPKKFQFLSKNGWPRIEKDEEANIEILQLFRFGVVTIQRCFDLPPLGIKWHNDKCVGFIFIDYSSYLSDARNKILEDFAVELKGINFEFLTTQKWPVSQLQEEKLTVWDICNENFCYLNKVEKEMEKPKKRPLKLFGKTPRKKKCTSQFQQIQNSILISYVHCEASTHARNLKAELQNMGLESDIDDISPGQDWQDVINNALNNCTAFVALVTPRYGETKWTNREAKLADDKEKQIIPVSFLDKWPPDQLAIQFLSLQYIPWKILDEVDEGGVFNDISSWDQRCVHRVAKEIKKICTEQEVSTPDINSISLLNSNPLLSNGTDMFYAPNNSQKSKHSIIISAHPEQKKICGKNFENVEGREIRCLVFIRYIRFFHEKAYSNDNLLKQSNSYYSSCSELKNVTTSPEYENLKAMKFNFKRKVKEANCVVVVMSEDYNKSKICMQQAYYCEQRVDVIVIKYGEFQIENIILNFFPEQDMLKFSGKEDSDFFSNLKVEIVKILDDEGKSRKSYKDEIQKMVQELSSVLKIETCVYVIGGTSGVSKNAEQFCIYLGAELAKLPSFILVTEGFFGAGDLVGRNYCEEKEIRAKGQQHSIYHIIPKKDHNITGTRARQQDDGSFEKIPYGQTLFFGNSISERDDIVSSTFKICLLIEGGERSACLAEKFLWNDCIVIPIIFNNGSISSKHCLSESFSKVPSGVNPYDWSALNEFNKPDLLAKTVKKIVVALLRRVLSNSTKTKH